MTGSIDRLTSATSSSARELPEGETASAADYMDISEAISHYARDRGPKLFIDSVDQGKTLTFAQLEHYCRAISGYLTARGIHQSARVSVIGKNSIETLLIYFGVLFHGAVINPINVDESPENIIKILNLVKPALVLHERNVALERGSLGESEFLPFDNFDDFGVASDDFFSRLAQTIPVSVIPRPTEYGLAEILFTSGTTSTPKGVCIARGPLHAMAWEVVVKMGITGSDVLFEYRNYNWASAQLLTILSSLLTGATLVLAQKFSRSRFPSMISRGVTIAAGVPTVINILAHEPVTMSSKGLGTLRFMTSSSAPLSVANQLEFEKIYGIPIVQAMGMSEAGFMLGNPFEGRKIGAAGTPCKYKEVFFVRRDGERCEPGEEGELVVKGYSMGLGYLQEDGSIAHFSKEGIRTGDLGHMDEDGFVFITGRAKDLIIRGGVNIAPMEITTRIIEHPAVKEAATLGVPHDIYGEEVVSFVVPKNGQPLSESEIIEHCRKSLPEFKLPKKVYFLEAIPKSERGKVSNKDLLKIFQDRQ